MEFLIPTGRSRPFIDHLAVQKQTQNGDVLSSGLQWKVRGSPGWKDCEIKIFIWTEPIKTEEIAEINVIVLMKVTEGQMELKKTCRPREMSID